MSDDQKGRTETQNGESGEDGCQLVTVLQTERQVLKVEEGLYLFTKLFITLPRIM